MIWIFVTAFGNAGYLVINDATYASKELAMSSLPDPIMILDNGAYLICVDKLELGITVLTNQTFRVETKRSPNFTISPVPLFDVKVSDYDLGPKNFYLI